MPHQHRWNHLIQRLTGNPPPPDAFQRLVSAYTEPHRHYHTLSHLDHCLAEFDQVKTLCTSPDAVEFAIWLHDVVYDTHAADNEEKSAGMAAEILYQCNCQENRVEKVRELILATKHLQPPTDMDAQLFVDIDLSILGQPPDVFQTYEKNIRRNIPGYPPKNSRTAGQKSCSISWTGRLSTAQPGSGNYTSGRLERTLRRRWTI